MDGRCQFCSFMQETQENPLMEGHQIGQDTSVAEALQQRARHPLDLASQIIALTKGRPFPTKDLVIG